MLALGAVLSAVAIAVADAETDTATAPDPAALDLRRHEWDARLSLGGSHHSGPRTTISAGLGAELEHRFGRWSNRLEASFDYNRSGDDLNTRRFHASARTRRDLSRRLYAFGLLVYRNDKFSGFDYQMSEAAGAGYRFVDSEKFRWDLEAGPSLRQSRVRATDQFAREIFVRAGSQLLWRISETAEFRNETSLLYNGSEVEIRSVVEAAGAREGGEVTNSSALELTILSDITARIRVEITYSSDPPPGGHHTESFSKVELVRHF